MFLFKKMVNWMKGQRPNKDFKKLVRNILTNKQKKPTSIFLTSSKLLINLWPLVRFTIFEEKPYEIEEKHCKCSLEEE